MTDRVDQPPEQVHELAGRRAAARKAKDYATADQLRGQITELGWLVTDTPSGYDLVRATGDSPPGPSADQVWPDPAAIPAAGQQDGRVATVALLIDGWPDDLRGCVAALLEHAPPGVVISALDVGNTDSAGDVIEEIAARHPGRIETRHVAASPGWSASRNALLRADPGLVHVIMETSTILTGDAITPLLTAVGVDGVVAAGWRGVDPDADLRGFHDAGPGQVTALLGYLLAVRAGVAQEAGGFPAKARFYRNADLEFSLTLGSSGRLVVPAEPLPARQTHHRGYHDTDPEHRDRESLRNYRRVLELLRARQGESTAGS